MKPTNNLAERSLRFAVLWRKRSFGPRVDKGDHFVKRILSLRQTCRLQKKAHIPRPCGGHDRIFARHKA